MQRSVSYIGSLSLQVGKLVVFWISVSPESPLPELDLAIPVMLLLGTALWNRDDAARS